MQPTEQNTIWLWQFDVIFSKSYFEKLIDNGNIAKRFTDCITVCLFLLVIITAIECFPTACVTPINYLWGKQSNKIKYLFQCLEIMFLAGNITIYPFLFMNSKIMIEYKIRICHWYTTLESSFFNIYVSDKNSFFLNKMAFLFYGLLFRFSTRLTVTIVRKMVRSSWKLCWPLTQFDQSDSKPTKTWPQSLMSLNPTWNHESSSNPVQTPYWKAFKIKTYFTRSQKHYTAEWQE